MHARWRRMDHTGRLRVWGFYGWFTALIFCGSIFGAAAWAAWLRYLLLFFTANQSPADDASVTQTEKYSLEAQGDVSFAVFLVAYAIEFLCLSAAKLMVLDRMMGFALPKANALRMRWTAAGRVMMALVVAGNVVGLAANIVAAVYLKQLSDLDDEASAALACNNSLAASSYIDLGSHKVHAANVALSVQQFCEVIVLLLIIFSFAFVGVFCIRRFSAAPPPARDVAADTSASSRHLRRQIVTTVAVVFVTFILRASFSLINSLANALQNNGSCSSDVSMCAPTCYNTYALMQGWLIYTPEFQLVVMLISSPLALLVALWGMTSERTLQQMESSQLPMQTARENLLSARA